MSQTDFLHLFSIAPSVFFSFLGTKAIVSLDSACANHNIRNEFLASLQGASLTHLSCARPGVEWYARRKARPGIIIVDKWMHEVDAILLSEVTAFVKDIYVVHEAFRRHDPSLPLAMRALTRYCPQLQKIHWSGRWMEGACLDTADYIHLPVCCPNLTELTIHNRDFQLADFETILRNSRNLTSIDVCKSWALVAGRALESVVELCPRLTALHMDRSNTVDGGIFLMIATQLSALHSLQITEYNDALAHVVPTGFTDFAQNCRSIRSLQLRGVQFAAADVLSITARSPHLEELGLNCCRCTGGDNNWFEQLVMLVPDLCVVELQRSSFVTNEAVQVMTTQCPRLQNIDLRNVIGIDVNTMTAITTRFAGLLILALGIIEFDVDALVESIAHHCAHLERLTLGYSLVSQPSIDVLATHCNNLTSLSLRALGALDFSVAAPYLGNLKVLDLVMLTMSDASLLQIVTHCRQVRYLSLRQQSYHNIAKDIHIVHAIEKNCHLLHTFHMLSPCSRKIYKALRQLQRARESRNFTFSFYAEPTHSFGWF